MGRRKRTNPLHLLAFGGALFLMMSLVSAGGGHPGVMITLFVAVPAVVGYVLYTEKQKKFERARHLTLSHANELAIKRKQLLGAGSYGIVDSKPWAKEINRFIDLILAQVYGGEVNSMRPQLHMMVDQVAASIVLSDTFYAGMPPTDYEHFVASELRRFEWAARVSGKTGDQGVDVLATKGRLRLVVQCKLYTKPVGNAAVQEAIAGRGWEAASHAIVVSNSSYTRSAQQLAASQGVLLLHHDQLAGLEARLTTVSAGSH